MLEAGGLDITVLRPEAEQKADEAGAATVGQPPVKDENGKAKGEKCAAGTNAKRYNRRTKAEGPFGRETRGVKRKLEKGFDEDGDDGREDMKGEQLA